ncbi:MAG TPA: hypothetical protein PKM27_06855 [Saprospiraceae bacterium]|nr:hypothetical protein [Saprospiraceae bacterium]
MKKGIGLVLLIFIIASAQAQDSVKYIRYKVVQRNGSSLVGQIMEKKADGPYVVVLDNGALVEIREKDVLRLKPVLPKDRVRRPYVEPSYKWGLSTEIMVVNNGIQHIGEPGLATGASISAQRYLIPQLSTGLGLGLYNYDLGARRMFVPLFGEARYRLIRHTVSPLLVIKGGYGFAAKNDINGLRKHEGGIFVNPFLGYEFGTGRKVSWTIGIGLLFQRAYYSYINGQDFFDEAIRFRRTEFKLGIAIH